jgi:single-strand DNA-binding protein
MAKGVNKVIIVGHLGADPDVRYSASGLAVVRFNVATTERVSAGEGNWEDRTEWHRIVAFGKTAENCGNYLSKGRLVYVEGRLQTRQWEDQQGAKRYTTEIVARDVVFLSGSGDQSFQGQSQQAGMGSRGRTQGHTEPAMPDELPPPSGPPEDDIPF